jgi:hypothetical protein
MLEKGETVLLEGRAGYETPLTRGKLTLTDRRLLWEKSLSIDPFGDHEIALPLSQIRSCEADGDAIKLDTEKGEVFIFPQWWALSLLTGNRRTKEWLRELTRAISDARGGAKGSGE